MPSSSSLLLRPPLSSNTSHRSLLRLASLRTLSSCSTERVYVAAPIYDTFIAALKEILSRYIVGDPMDKSTQIGPVISKRSQQAITAQIGDALNMGAKDETPSNASFQNMPPDGNYV